MGGLRYKNYCQGAYYHIYNRGNEKQNIFIEERDYIYYLKKCWKAKEKNKITLIAYCLNPNHIHLVVKQNYNIPAWKFISSLHTSYAMYFNKKYNRVGHLFQDRFKQKNIEKDDYLLYLTYYVHLNSKIHKLVKSLEDYPWSSYLDYIKYRNGKLCDKSIIKDIIGRRKGQSFNDVYKKLIKDIENNILSIRGLNNCIKDCP